MTDTTAGPPTSTPSTGSETAREPARPEGVPTWLDLGTSDLAGARAFYGELFGWTFTDQGEDVGHYHLIHAGEALVGGAMDVAGMTHPEFGALPTEWGVWLATADIAGALERVAEAGGRVAMAADRVGDQGTMALVVDPSGACVGLWQADALAGFTTPSNAPGTAVWFELMTTDFDAALPFYRDVLGWDVHWSAGGPDAATGEDAQAGDGWRYVTHGEESRAAAGMCDAAGVFAPGEPSRWRIYLATTDLDRDLARLPDLGGRALDGPVDSPYGRLATVADPQGATFQLLQPTW